MNIEHDLKREQHLQEMCRGILSISPEFWDNPNGPCEHRCPLCGNIKRDNNYNVLMSEISHEQDCPYLIAKDLSTNISL